MHDIVLVALPDAIASSICLPVEMLSAAEHQLRSRGWRHSMRRRICRLGAESPRMAGGLRLEADAPFSEVEHCDWLILPTRWRHPLKPLPEQERFLAWLHRLGSRGTRICTVSTGSFLLAEAGLLEGRAATTHWYYFDEFARRYPGVALTRDHLITEADGLFCAGSVNSLADLMVYLIGETWGGETARHVERQFSPEIRRPFQQHAYRAGATRTHGDEAIAMTQAWLESKFDEAVNMDKLAEHAGLGLRNFHRRFRRATGVTPLQYLQRLRLEAALELLRNSNLSVAEVAQQVGYSDTSYFCRLIREHSGQTPAEYRRAVRRKLFTV